MYIRTTEGLAQAPLQYSLGAWTASPLPAGANGKLYQFKSKNGGSTTAVYVPNAALALAAKPVQLLVWIHGDILPCCDEGKDAVSYVTSETFPLAKQLADSKRPFVLVAPTMHWKPGQPMHTLGDPAKMNAFLDEVRIGLTGAGWSSAPSFGRLILAGHSHAYAVLNNLAARVNDAQSSNGALAKLTDVWLLDTTYGKSDKWKYCKIWLEWAKATAKAKIPVNLRIFYRRDSNTAAVAECIRDEAAKARLNKVTVRGFNRCLLSHCDMPRALMPSLLAASVPGPFVLVIPPGIRTVADEPSWIDTVRR
jgi:hypothetical protein